MRPSPALTLTALAMAACASPVEVEVEVETATADDYAVYSAVLESEEIKGSSTRYVIDSEAKGAQGDLSSAEPESIPGLLDETFDDLVSRTTDALLEPRFTATTPVDVVPREELNALLAYPPGDEPAAWRRFEQKYPGAFGIVSLSRVGYDRTRTQALVGVSRYCGSLCGIGWAVLLSFSDGRWTVTQVKGLWIS